MTPARTALVVVESPAKARTLQRYLGPAYVVMASRGHICDLPKSGLQVDTDHGYVARYALLDDHVALVAELRRAANAAECDAVLLATDPDREGEAIAWHVARELRGCGRPMARVEFREITRRGVDEGLAAPRAVDERRVAAQQARRVLDRLIGYELSPVLWKRLARRAHGHHLSAGRVQSVALRLLVEREDEIAAFVPEARGVVAVDLCDARKRRVTARLDAPPEPEAIVADLAGATFAVEAVERREHRRRAPPPYVTSTLQRDAARRLGFSAARTMQVAQRLYEGVDLGDEGPVGLVTYVRTDSTRLSAEAVGAARAYIRQRFGREFLPDDPTVFDARRGAQDAHEAIRPTLLEHHPDAIRKHLRPDDLKLYRLIWERFLACQMVDARYERITVVVAAQGRAHHTLRASRRSLTFAGWLDAQGARDDEAAGEEAPLDDAADDDAPDDALPPLAPGDALTVADPPGVRAERRLTKPPPRYDEGALVKALEDLGIGRPGTYAEIVRKVLARDYVEKRSGELVPTRLGVAKTRGLAAAFPGVLDYAFTAGVERDLDAIEAGREAFGALVDRIYRPFKEAVDAELAAPEPGPHWPRARPSERVCDACGSAMVRRWGPVRDYDACAAYPKCRNVVDDAPPAKPAVYAGHGCPECGHALLVKTRRGTGERFLTCERWGREDPACAYSAPMPAGEACPKCGGAVVRVRGARGRRAFWGCANGAVGGAARCDYTRPREEAGDEER